MSCNHSVISHSSDKCCLRMIYCGKKILDFVRPGGLTSSKHTIESFHNTSQAEERILDLGLEVDLSVAKRAVEFGLKLKINKKRSNK